jgi:hypothetical protein
MLWNDSEEDGVLAVSVRKMKPLTVKVVTVTLISKGRKDMTCFVYSVYEMNSKVFFLSRRFIFGGLS